MRLHVVDSGEKPGQSGPPLLFLHGLLGQLNHFSFALAALFPERRVVLLDRPGSGYSQAAPSQALAAQADLAAKVIALFEFAQAAGGRPFLRRGRRLGAGARSSRKRRRARAGRAPDPSLCAAAKSIAGLGMRNRLARWLGVWTLGPIVALMRIGLTQRMVFAPDLMIAEFWTRAGGFLAVRPSPMLAAGRRVARGSKGTDRHGGALRRADGSGRRCCSATATSCWTRRRRVRFFAPRRRRPN